MSDLYKMLIRPLFFKMEAETAHEIVCGVLSCADNIPVLKKITESLLRSPKDEKTVFGIKFPNALGLAAGFDKNALFPNISSALGFGHIEVGTVTPKPQPGNLKPRLFRVIEEGSIINRMGFNNDGAEAMSRRLEKNYPKLKRMSPLGINIGKAKSTPLEETLNDYLLCIGFLHKSADYFTINISSPNTPGLRDLHKEEFLDPLLKGINERLEQIAANSFQKKIPYLLKISPDEDFSSMEKILEIAVRHNVSGIIATNTTTTRPNNITHTENGGLSGKAIEEKSLGVIKFIARLTNNKLPIIGVGGISDGNSASKKLDAGASLLQLYSGLVFEGPLLPKKVLAELYQRKVWLA